MTFHERKLVINEVEAVTVRRIFERYLALGSIGELAGELDRDGIRSKARTLADGTACGNRTFSKGAVAHILNSRLYIGEITHKGESFPGEHPAIIDRVTWEAVQAKLDANRRQYQLGSHANQPSLLAGMIEDSEGRAMTPRHTPKGNRRYRYYITAPDTPDGKMPNDGWRVPAGEIEQLVRMRLGAWLGDQATLVGLFAPLIEQAKLRSLVQACADHGDAIGTTATTELRERLLAMDLKVAIEEKSIAISFAPMLLAQRLANIDVVDHSERHTITIAAALSRRGQELRLAYSASDKAAPVDPDVKLIGLIAKAETAHRTLIAGDRLDKNQRNRLVRMARLKFLAPDIVTAILDGHQPVHLSARKLLREAAIPLCWKQQRELLGF